MFQNGTLMCKFITMRSFKSIVQSKIPMLNEIYLEDHVLATLHTPLDARPAVPTLAGDPRPSGVLHHKIREEVFEKWSQTSKCDKNTTWIKNTILS